MVNDAVESGRWWSKAGRRAIAMLALASLASCHSESARDSAARQADPASPPIQPVASIKELMDSVVDPAADGLWGAVATISTIKGVERREPRTDEEWKAVRRHAISLIEGMNLAMMEGRHAAPSGAAPGPGESRPEEIDAAIAQNRPEFNQFADLVRGRAIEALHAIDKKDPKALFSVGSQIDSACESCHVTFWYPNSPRPAT